ncbi:hypothetical protein BDZ89DRAFT_720087 [Hymenopellis radicata]|nr:hypothetical protein BDZ89DRAFT_720087 [Hymenopellis radicata]
MGVEVDSSPTMPITHSESRWLVSFADKIRSRIVAVICESVFYGIHIILLIVAFRFLFRPDGFRSWRRMIMIATTLLMFAISTALWALDIADLMVPVQLLHEMTNAIPKFSDSKLNQWRFFAQTILYTFEFIIGDAVVVWRAYALSGSRKRVLIPLVVMLAASLGMGLYFLGCIMEYGRYLGRPKRCSRSQIATYFISLGTNFCATFVIVYQVWRYRRTMNDIAPLLKHQKSEYIHL